ncbi:MAG: hypothetical protein KDE59_19280 [Anaerolineales bacterium]|nr:hypothetical protein [Anaerolineales bacterium]MCB0007552.1 hypothetical protein [Anaerolineales bacterium]
MNWWQELDPELLKPLAEIWIPVGSPGYAGANKAAWTETLTSRFGADGWRISHYVRGQIVPKAVAIQEYEEAYRRYIRANPALVRFLTTTCGNVYDDNVTNVYDDNYEQPHTAMNHYQDIATRRVIAELVQDPDWPDVVATPAEEATLIDLGDGQRHRLPRAAGFRGDYLLQIREPHSSGFMLNPAVIPIHDPALITTIPNQLGWYHHEGCGHLSVEAFWQMSKVVEVRYDRFITLGEARAHPLSGIETGRT